MPTTPSSIVGRIEFSELHYPVWIAHAAGIGLPAAAAAAFKVGTIDARAAYAAALAAREESKAATTALHNAMTDLAGGLSDALRLIRTFAETTDDPNVYAVAQIPPPAAPSPVPAPGKPTDLKFTLNPGGSITFKWKSTDAGSSSGAYFNVARRLQGETGFTAIGGSPNRSFTDTTLPLGVSQTTYIITPGRGGLLGTPSDQTTVQFGVGAGGGMRVTTAPIAQAA